MLRILLLSVLFFSSRPALSQTAYIDTTFAQVPLTFTMNQGQFLPQIKFIAEGNNENLTMKDVEDSSYTYVDDGYQLQALAKPSSVSATSDSIFIKLYSFMEFYNINQNPEFLSENPSSWNSNYYIGNNRDDWRMDVPNYAKITHKNLYNGIDLEYSAEKRRIKYDIIVRKGADPSQIQFKLPLNNLVNGRITHTYTVVLGSKYTKAFFNPPDCFQYIDGKEVKIDLKYREIERINGKDYYGNNVVYVIAGYDISEYNPDYELHIKPKYIDSISYMGKRIIGSITGMDVDDSGNVYATGEAGFPANVQVFSTKIYILKLDEDSEIPVFVSYIIAYNYITVADVKIDNAGNAYIAGDASDNFPVTENSFDNNFGNRKCYVLKLNFKGDTIDYSTFLGGTGYYGQHINALDVDNFGNVIVAGETYSNDFPVTPSSLETNYNSDEHNDFITKFNSEGDGLIFSTFFTGARTIDIYIDESENIYLSGKTSSYRFPLTMGSYNYEYNKTITEDYPSDVFVTKVNKDGKNLIFSTHLGGSATEEIRGMAVNHMGDVFVIGSTNSTDLPTTLGAYDTTFGGGNWDAFILKLSDNGSKLGFSSYIGGDSIDYGHGICLDDNNNIFIVGDSSSSNFPVTENNQLFKKGGFFIKFESNGELEYSKFITDMDVFGIISDNLNNFFIKGITHDKSFPVKGGFFDTAFIGTTETTNYPTQYLVKLSFKNFDSVQDKNFLELNFHLNNPFPNPSNSSFTISYSISKESNLELEIFNISGQIIDTIFSGIQKPGNYNVSWKAKNLSSGVFFCRLKTNEFSETRRFILLK